MQLLVCLFSASVSSSAGTLTEWLTSCSAECVKNTTQNLLFSEAVSALLYLVKLLQLFVIVNLILHFELIEEDLFRSKQT